MKIKFANAVFLTLFFTVIFAYDAYAIQKARPIATDNRIRTYFYNPDEIYALVGHYRYQTSIIFEQNEEISAISLGDSVGWQISPQGNRIFLKPVEPDATTNMTVITDKRTYNFELYAEEASSIRDEDLIFEVRFVYGTKRNESVKVFKRPEDLIDPNESVKPDLSRPENYNFNYTISGSELIAPVKIFDDGEFTYFQFRDKNSPLPGIFQVESDGSESLINYRIVDEYVMVERVTSQYTLRSGNEITCVFNESRPLKIQKEQGFLGKIFGSNKTRIPKKRK